MAKKEEKIEKGRDKERGVSVYSKIYIDEIDR
jgi:hypothetical protein